MIGWVSEWVGDGWVMGGWMIKWISEWMSDGWVD